ncbi:MAG: hypothetical protein CSA39_00420 [Flavobacteriales bacterium]|nr:MAG: hypothetical protein CSA39_00420 [Flavobacteriales bacterium]
MQSFSYYKINFGVTYGDFIEEKEPLDNFIKYYFIRFKKTKEVIGITFGNVEFLTKISLAIIRICMISYKKQILNQRGLD